MILRTTLALAASIALVGLLVVAAPEATGTDYRYFDREDLFREKEKWVGTGAVVTDVMLKIWPDELRDPVPQSTRRTGLGDRAEGAERAKDLPASQYLRFETRYFRCAVEKSNTEAVELLKSLAEQKDDARFNKRLVTIWALVDRPELWGSVFNPAEGPDTEMVVLKVDKVTKPRERFFLDLDLDEDW